MTRSGRAVKARRWAVLWAALLVGVGTLSGAAAAQPSDRAAREEVERRFVEAFAEKDWELAEAAARAWMKLRPEEHAPVYNLACVLARRGELDAANETLLASIRLGMTDRRRLDFEGSFAPLRRTEAFKAVVAAWPRLLDEAADARLERAKRMFPKGYLFEKDATLRLAYVCGYPEASLRSAREEVGRLTAMWSSAVLPEGVEAVSLDEARPDPWVTVCLPAKRDFAKWGIGNFGKDYVRIPGVYDHMKKELVSDDLGPTLRHEYWHVLHWRHCDRLGQTHPFWVQEGLCSLVEDLRDDGDRGLVPLPSWRTNMVKRIAMGGRLPTLARLTSMSPGEFVRERPLLNYAMARLVFLYLSDQRKLRAWYTAYTGDGPSGYANDPSGALALAEVMGREIGAIDKDLRAYARGLPLVPDEENPPDAELPVVLGRASGDGIAVDRGEARSGGLRAYDVVMAVEGQFTRDKNELARVLGGFKPGDQVTVEVRRGRETASVAVTLSKRARE